MTLGGKRMGTISLLILLLLSLPTATLATPDTPLSDLGQLQAELDRMVDLRDFYDGRVKGLEDQIRDTQLHLNTVTIPACLRQMIDMKNLIEVRLLPDSSRAYIYDQNQDGIKDVVAIVPAGENRYPEEYQIDRDYDHQPDYIFLDKIRNGQTCTFVQKELPEKAPSNRHQGTPLPAPSAPHGES